jgi:hypothetical protein
MNKYRDEDGEGQPIDEIMKARRIARKRVNDAASRGDPIAGALEALEHLAEPFFLGVDEDPDDSDLGVFP